MGSILRFGPVGIEWRCDGNDPRWAPFRAAYGPWLEGGGQPDLAVESDIVPSGRGLDELPASFIRERTVRGRAFDCEGFVRGEFAGDLCRCAIDPLLLAGSGLRVLEQFLYLLFYTASLRRGPAGTFPFLLHSAAVLHEGGVLLLCGPSGSGKSTAAGLCPAGRLLTDEAAALVPGAGGLRVAGSPVNPFCAGRAPGEGPLAGLYLLEQAPEHAVLPVARPEAVPRLAAEVVAPMGLLETDFGPVLGRALDCALALQATGLVRRLRFRPDAGFWDLVAS